MSDEPKGKAKGGVARAIALTPERRKEISMKGVKAKQERAKMPKATHFGILNLGGTEIRCFVLDDGRRVLSGRSLTTAIGMKGRGQGVARISSNKLINYSENSDLILAIENPIKFIGKSPKGVDEPSDGFEATVLQEICEAILSARDKGLVNSEHDKRYATKADILIRGFARVGIIALVDEATGYQKDRAKNELAKILEAFVAKELQPYVRTFEIDFYEHLFRLRGLPFPNGTVKRPQYFGHLTNDIIYHRLAPGVLKELKEKAEKTEKGRLKHKLFQRLTPELGHPKLRDLMVAVTTIMKMSKKWQDFKENLDRLQPKYNDNLSFDFTNDSGEGF
jgi:P63C domain